MSGLRIAVVLSVCVLSFRGVASAEDWRRWRGPSANGSSGTADPPVHWGLDRNIRWKVEVPGSGSSTPIVWHDNVLVLTAIASEQKETRREDRPGPFGTRPKPTVEYLFVLLCYDRATGREKWRSIAAREVPHEAGHLTNTYASSSPVTDGRRVFVSFGSRGIYCFDSHGRRLWKRGFGKMETRRDFGEASSPALQGDTLVVPWDHEEQSFIVALDAQTGDVKWKTDRDELTTWATPIIVRHRDRFQVITNGSKVRSYDLQSGELVWECGGQVSNPIPGPVAEHGVVYCMTGYRGNAVYAISLDSRGDVTGSDNVVWSRNDAAPYVSSPALYKGRLYFTKARSSILSVLDAATGWPLIDQQRLDDMTTMYASPVAAADRVYFTSREGTTVVIRHSDEVEVLATNRLAETIDASPAIVDNEMFLRGEKHLFCIAEE